VVVVMQLQRRCSLPIRPVKPEAGLSDSQLPPRCQLRRITIPASRRPAVLAVSLPITCIPGEVGVRSLCTLP